MTAPAPSNSLPALPEPRAIRAGFSFPKTYAQAYTADQMREYARAALASRPEGYGWISVEEQMPPVGELVWVYKPRGRYGNYALDTWNEQHECPVSFSTQTIPVGLGWDDEDDFLEITHWQLPTPPKAMIAAASTGIQGAKS